MQVGSCGYFSHLWQLLRLGSGNSCGGGGGADGKQVFFLEAHVFCGSCFAICPHRHRRRIPFMLVGGVSKKHEVVHMYDRFMCFCKLGCGLVCS
jgi:hypothetical protein